MNAKFHRHFTFPVIALALFAGTVLADAGTPLALPTLELSAEANRTAPNDLAQATAYFESTDADPAALSRTVNSAIATALELIKAYPDVKAGTSGINTWPVHSRNGRTIDAWRMRSAISLESSNIPALSELLGKLQATLAVTSLIMQPAPETRAATADLAATDAIRAFEARADTLSRTLGKRYRIRHLSVNYSGGSGPIYPMMRSAMVAEDATSVPLEGGETQVVVNVTGVIELVD